MKLNTVKLSLAAIAAIAAVLTSCRNDTPIPRIRETRGIQVVYPEGLTVISVKEDTLTFTNRTTGVSKKAAFGDTITLSNGLYDCFYNAVATYTDKQGTAADGEFYGAVTSVEIGDGAPDFTIEAHLRSEKGDFIIEEIFFTGTLYPTGKQYYGDGYVKIYNNTDHVLYADGIALVESKFVSTIKWDYVPDIQSDTMTIHAIYVVPGSGTDHPVEPGESFIICDTGIDHRNANSNSFDLSRADFEWYDVSNVPAHMDIDSETVPNLDKWYCYTNSFFVLHNRGFRSYAIARVPLPKEEYLEKYWYTYTYVMHIEAGDFPMEQEAYKLPNSWIVDGVNCSVETERLWNILPPSIDAGWTHCGAMDHDKTRYFKSVRRKMTGLTEDGHRILQDTNNSTDDFNTECVPSIIEEQGTSIWSDGTKATGRTYDGVKPIETDVE